MSDNPYMKEWEKIRPTVNNHSREFLDEMVKSLGVSDITELTDREILVLGDSISSFLEAMAMMITEFWEGSGYNVETGEGDPTAHPNPVEAFQRTTTIAAFLWGGCLEVVGAERRARGIMEEEG